MRTVRRCEPNEDNDLTRKLSLLMLDTSLDYDTDDCGTSHYIECNIKNKRVLERLNKRWILDEENSQLLLLENNPEFIGQTVKLRSPITCALHDGKVCRTCYGELSELNKKIHVGILSVLFLTSVLTQQLLSAKHLLQTKAPKIDWSDDFYKNFNIQLDQIYIKESLLNSHLILNREDLKEDEDNENLLINKFQIKNSKEILDFDVPIDLIITNDLLSLLEEYMTSSNIIKVPLEDFDIYSPIFKIIMKNNELAAPLNAILELLEVNSHLGLSNIHDIYNKFIELLNESNINMNSVHIELILKALTRDINDHMKFPDYSQDNFPEYKVLRVTDANLNSPSVSIGLAFEQVKKQLLSSQLYEKNGVSILDTLL